MVEKLKNLLKSRRFVAILINMGVVMAKEVFGLNLSEEFIWQLLAATGIFVAAETMRSSESKTGEVTPVFMYREPEKQWNFPVPPQPDKTEKK